MTKKQDALGRLELIVAAQVSQDPTLQQAAQQVSGELVAEQIAAVAEAYDTPNADGHSPRMLEDWRRMLAQHMAVSGKNEADADADLDLYFGDIEAGRRDEHGNWLGDGGDPALVPG